MFSETLKFVGELLPDIKNTRWGNKTDFYTLYIALASLLRTRGIKPAKMRELREAIDKFAAEIDRRLADEGANVSKTAMDYVRAVEKGANDKKRRADRHVALMSIIGSFFGEKKGSK